MSEQLTLFSSIKPTLLRKALLRGFFLALAGILLLILAGTLLDPTVLQIAGLWIFLASIGLIAWGLIPYRRLTKKASNPQQLVLTNEGYLELYFKGKRLLALPTHDIKKCAYLEQGDIYGIGIWLQPDFEINLSGSIEQFKSPFKCHLFLAYFTKKSFDELSEAITKL